MKVGKLIGGLVTVAVIAVGGYLLWQSGALAKMVPEVETDCKSLLDKVQDKDASKYVKATVDYKHSTKDDGVFVYERGEDGKFNCADEKAPVMPKALLNVELKDLLRALNDSSSEKELQNNYTFKTGLDTYTVIEKIHEKSSTEKIGDTTITIPATDINKTFKYNTDGMLTYYYDKTTSGSKTTTEEFSVKLETK